MVNSNPLPDELLYGIAEYNVAAQYHNSQPRIRFTIAGFYIAVTGVLASGLVDASWSWRIVLGFIGFFVTGCIWVMELRTRAVNSSLALRCVDIERHYWGLNGQKWYEGVFSRLYKTRPQDTVPLRNSVPEKPGPDCPNIFWFEKPLPPCISKHISHARALDILYFSGLVLWGMLFIISAYNVLSQGTQSRLVIESLPLHVFQF